MRTFITKIMMIATILSFFGCKDKSDPSTWSDSKTSEWFEKGEWKNGWNVNPDLSINKKAMAMAYHKNKERWNSAFNFLKSNDLTKLEVKRHDIDGDNLFVNVSEYNTRSVEESKYEAHRKYIDIQYVVTGREMIGVAPLASADSVLQSYDGTKDVEFMRIKGGNTYPANQSNFFVFFPEDAHMPSLQADTAEPVRKVVVKVRID